ncbi:MAG TPA: hypothetical protein PLF96_01765 [Thermotogota bacterium]|nr:hypothetical protein [Thermotogota bacterium]
MLLIVFGTLAVLSVGIFIFARQFRKRMENPQIDYEEFEERVLNLVSRFQHISATRLSALEQKIEEISGVLKKANQSYFQLSALLGDIAKARVELESLHDRWEQLSPGSLQGPSQPPAFSREERESSAISADAHTPLPLEEGNETEVSPPQMDLSQSSIEHKILNLSSEGHSADEIARQLEIGRGEVRLVLELFRKKSG